MNAANLPPRLQPDGGGSPEPAVISRCMFVLKLMCAAALCFIMGLTVIDVSMSYFLSSPITGSAELVMFAMAILIFSAFPLVTLNEQHISVGILQGRLAGRWLWLQRLVILCVSLLACAAMAWQLLHDAHQLSSDQQATMVLELPLGALDYFMGTMSGLSAMAVVLLLLKHFGRAAPVREGSKS